MAAVNGHHVAGTEYHWFHEWKPRDIATAMVYGKASPHGPHSEALRKVSHNTLGHRLDQSAAKGKFDVFDRLAAESDRRDAYKSNARASRQAKADAASAAKTAHYDQLTAAGHDDESAIEKAFGIPVAKQRDQAALGQLRASGHSGTGLQEAARKGFTAETKARYKAAEDATNGHMLSQEGRAAGVDPASLMTGSEARARKYASPELKAWFDQHGRPTYAEYLDEIRGHVQSAGRARAGRGAFHAAARRVLGVVALAADSMAKASSHEQVGKGGPLWKTPGLQLPAYIQHIANDLREKRGMDESRAIATAVAACKRWAAGGGKVDANTRAAASKAVAEWEAAKAKARGTVTASVTRAAVQLAYGAAPTVKPSPANRGQVHATTPAPKTPVQHKVGAKVRTPAGKTGTVVKSTKAGAHVMCPGDKRPTFHPHAKLTPAGRAVSASAARVSLQLAGAFNSAAHPRVSKGNTGGGQFTASGNAQAGASANGAGSKPGTNAAADNEAVNLMAKLQNMTPAQQSAFMAGLSGAQLQALGGWLSRNPQGTPAGKAAAAAILPVLAAHGLKPDGTMGGKAGGAKKPAGAKKAAGKSGGGKSSGGKSSGGKSSGGGSSKSGGGSSKSSASKSAAAQAAADKKAAAAKTAAEKKAAAAVAAAAKAKAAADAKAARAATAAQKKAAADAQKAAAAQVKAAAAAAKAAAAAAAAAKKKPPVPVPPPPPSRKPAVAAAYQTAGRRLLELATSGQGTAPASAGKQIPTVAHLRRAVQAFGQVPPAQQAGVLADIQGASTALGAGHLEWVSSFLRAHGTASR